MSCKIRRRRENEEQKTEDGDLEHLFTDEIREEMETMWEIPQIFHFLHLTKESLNIPQLSLYEMERMLLIPRASKQLANIMTCLLSSPTTKIKLRKVPPMPYEFWNNILAYKMTSWFKIYHAKHEDATKILETIGVEPQFWNIFPEASVFEGKDFEDLSFKQRTWLLKTVCDTIMHTRKTVQEDMVNQSWEDQFETLLGVDRNGARYIYFPQFMPNDFRIYRHSLDNKILSTVKPSVRQEQETERTKCIRYKKRKLQLRNNSSKRRSNNFENKNDDKDSNNDSTTGLFISEDTNLSSTSTCSNNNNNNISLETIGGKRRRSMSKMSEKSSLSNVKSSDYDTNSSDKSIDDESSQMFKGFVNVQNDNYNIEIINNMLDDLKMEFDKDNVISKCESSGELTSQGNLVELYKNDAVSYNEILIVEKDVNEKSNDNLSNNSKTDDEKLNEIINAENSKLLEDVYSKNISFGDNVSDISILTSKSDDEKLNETKTNNNVSMNENDLNGETIFSKLFCASSFVGGNTLLSKKVSKKYSSTSEIQLMIETELNNLTVKRNLRKKMKLRPSSTIKRNEESSLIKIIKDKQELNDEMDKTDEDFFTSESESQTNMEYDLDDFANGINTDCNLRKSNNSKTNECKQYFDKLLSDLSVSDFCLVADSVEGLKNLIATFSTSDSESNNVELIPLCEIKLIKNLNELLNSIEPMETTIKDAMRKAKAKLQREWSNFKEGVEDQDSSGESGLSSNWWILGSQGKDPFSISGDATLQTLSHSTLSTLGIQNIQKQLQQHIENEHENAIKNFEQGRHENRETNDSRQSRKTDAKQSEIEKSTGRNEIMEKRDKPPKHGKNESASNDEDTGQGIQHSKRVLRARGVSSYTEQLYSDYESDENELEEWTDVEAVYAAPSAQTDTSTSYVDTKDRNSGNWSEKEDSDQDWILPSSRKRKSKRSSTYRRLKSVDHKLQNIKENTSQSNVMPEASYSVNIKIVKDKLKSKFKDSKIKESKNRVGPQIADGDTVASAMSENNSKKAVPSTDTICKIESVMSVHSEIDIKNENPVESNPINYYEQNNYGSAYSQQHYYYYMMPQNSEIIPQEAIISQTSPYCIRPYVMQTPQNKFLPAVQQQPFYQQQNPQMILTQPYANNYIPYVAATTQPQGEYMIAPGTNQPDSQNPVYYNFTTQNRYNQNNNKSAIPRQSLSYSTITENNTTVGDTCQRFPKLEIMKDKLSSLSSLRTKRKMQTSSMENSGQKVTSLIMLSDSDDEIEMIVMEKTSTTSTKKTDRTRSSESQRVANQPKQKPTITSDITVPSTKGILSPQIIQRMSQGGISITPVKNNPPPTTNTNTQIVVVVNETGSHYALALPNGSKLILTPEQVAQIRASNGGKLIL